MATKEKIKDVPLNKAEYQENALFKALVATDSECLVLPKGALVLVGMNMCWSDVGVYPAFRTVDGGVPVLADLLLPEKIASIQSDDRPLRANETNILCTHVSNFLAPGQYMEKVVLGTPTSESGDAEKSAPVSRRATRMRKSGAESSAKTLVSVGPSLKKTKIAPVLSRFAAARQAALAVIGGTNVTAADATTTLAEGQTTTGIETPLTGGTSAPAGVADRWLDARVSTSAMGDIRLSMAEATTTTIFVFSLVAPATAVVQTTAIVMKTVAETTPVTPLTSIGNPLPIHPLSSIELSYERVEDTAGSSSDLREEDHVVEGLYLPTITWDNRLPDRPYKPKWRIAESSRLIHPHMVNHWVEHAFPPAEVAYMEGQDCGQLLDVTLTDAVSGVRRIAEKNDAGPKTTVSCISLARRYNK